MYEDMNMNLAASLLNWVNSLGSTCLERFFLLVIVLSVLLRFTAFDDPVGIFWSLCCPSFFDLRLLMTPLVSFGHYVVRPSSIYSF